MKKYKKQMKVRKFLDHFAVVGFMTLLTIYALFFDDIRVLAYPKESDDVFYGITLLAIILFSIEIVLASYSNPKFMGTFFFYMDILATLTMVPDCGWIWA
jgi:hypothetical protein